MTTDTVVRPSVVPPAGRPSLLRSLAANRAAMVGLAFIAIALTLSLAAPLIAPYGMNEQNLVERLQGISADHWLGTDDYGRDVLTRLLYGGRNTLLAALEAMAVAVALGLPPGLIAGVTTRWVDSTFSRIADALQVVPPLLLALSFVAVLGRGLTQAMLAVGLVTSPRVFRIVRAATLQSVTQPYVEAARSVGGSRLHILVRHVLPNIASPLIVEVVYLMSLAMLVEAALAFLGVGTQIPHTSWGDLLSRGIQVMEEAPHMVIVPGLMIFLAVSSFNAIGDGLRRALVRGRQ